MKSDNYFDILSIDGGGIKGLYSAKLLELLESKYGAKSYECFDLICGTSTGGLIALAVASGNKAEKISSFYQNNGDKIFPDKLPFKRKFKSILSYLFTSKYSNESLKKLLCDFFEGSNVMHDLIVPVNIPSYSLDKGQQVIFKSSPSKELYIDKDVPIVDVALATSAAPTYFPIHEIKGTKARNGYYIDGGVWANDPALTGVLEAYRYMEKGDKKIRVLSISTVPSNPKTLVQPHWFWSKFRNYKRWSLISYGSKMFDFGIQAQQFQNGLLMNWLKDSLDIEYIRIQPDELSIEQKKIIEMDLATTDSIKQYKKMAEASSYAIHASHGTILNSIFSPKNITHGEHA